MACLADLDQFVTSEDLEAWNLHLELAWLVDGPQLPQPYLAQQQGMSESQPQGESAALFPMTAPGALAAYDMPNTASTLTPFFPYPSSGLPGPESTWAYTASLFPPSPLGSPLVAPPPPPLPSAPPALLSCVTTAAVNIRNTHFRCTLTVASGAVCGKEFKRPSELDRHTATVHERARVEACQLCEGTRTFTRRDTLDRHMRRYHQEAVVEEGARKPGAGVKGVVR